LQNILLHTFRNLFFYLLLRPRFFCETFYEHLYILLHLKTRSGDLYSEMNVYSSSLSICYSVVFYYITLLRFFHQFFWAPLGFA